MNLSNGSAACAGEPQAAARMRKPGAKIARPLRNGAARGGGVYSGRGELLRNSRAFFCVLRRCLRLAWAGGFAAFVVYGSGILAAAVAEPGDIVALNRLSGICLGVFRATGRLAELERAAQAARESLALAPAVENPEGWGAHAWVEMASHRFAPARDEARRWTELAPRSAPAFLLLGDALLELGSPDEAQKAWREAARLGDLPREVALREARLHWLRGEWEEAKAGCTTVIDSAPPEGPVKIQALVQRGQMAFLRGDWDGAEKDYLAAREIPPVHFTVLDHLAELRAAQRRFPEAVAMYEQVVASTGERPDFMQSLGDVESIAGHEAEAARWRERALAGYRRSEAIYLHQLAGYYSDVAPDPAEAVKWARLNLASRPGVYAYDALGWALYGSGDYAGAAEAAGKSLALGTPDAHLIFHAGMIFSRAGDLKRGGELLRRVAQVNPRYFNTFHVHR